MKPIKVEGMYNKPGRVVAFVTEPEYKKQYDGEQVYPETKAVVVYDDGTFGVEPLWALQEVKE